MAERANTRSEPWKAFRARERNSDVKREAVLLTAAHMFLEHGYRKTSMNELAKRLNITKPALYYYFHNKEQILIECYAYGIQLIEAGLDEASASHGHGFEKLKVYTRGYAAGVLLNEFGRCVAMLSDSELSPPTRAQVRKLKRRIDHSLRSYIEEGMADGSIGPCNPKLVSFAIAGAINWMGTWYREGGGMGAVEIGEQFANILTDGLRSGLARPKSDTAAFELETA
jgi:AcrR family transcriptional regulator